ncbi:MAG: DNA ligase-associated DEXH box helicase, partial [Terriglobia bacterium]
PPSAMASPWMKRFGPLSTAMASGWMRIRGTRRRRSIDRGFALSDHADWPDLQTAISATGAECVLVTHGYRAPMVRWLTEQGREARSLETRFEGEEGEAGDDKEDIKEDVNADVNAEGDAEA